MTAVDNFIEIIKSMTAMDLIELGDRFDMDAESVINLIRKANNSRPDFYITEDPAFNPNVPGGSSRKKIQAIKWTREIYGMDLKAAKETVEGKHSLSVFNSSPILRNELNDKLRHHDTGYHISR